MDANVPWLGTMGEGEGMSPTMGGGTKDMGKGSTDRYLGHLKTVWVIRTGTPRAADPPNIIQNRCSYVVADSIESKTIFSTAHRLGRPRPAGLERLRFCPRSFRTPPNLRETLRESWVDEVLGEIGLRGRRGPPGGH